MRERARLVVLLLAVAFVYHANLREFSSGDTVGNSLLPLSLLRDGDLYLDEFRSGAGTPGLHDKYYFLNTYQGHLVSRYPIVPALFAVPVYAVGMAFGIDRLGIDSPWTYPFGVQLWPGVRLLAKISASLLVLSSVALFYATIRRLVPAWTALLIAAAYGLGTASWSVSSQGLWLHGSCQMLLAAAMFCLLRETPNTRADLGAGVAIALAVATRVIVAPVAMALVADEWQRRGRTMWPVLVGPAIVLPVWLVYNLVFFGTLAGGQVTLMRQMAQFYDVPHLWGMPFAEGVALVLFSPSRGLFTLSPILLLAVPALASALLGRQGVRHRWLALSAVVFLMVLGKYKMWYGGFCFGSRLTADILPVLGFFIALSAARTLRPRLWWAAFVLLAIPSIAVQATGAFYFAPDEPQRRFYEKFWNVRDSDVVRCLRQPPFLVRHPEDSFLRSLRSPGATSTGGSHGDAALPAATRPGFAYMGGPMGPMTRCGSRCAAQGCRGAPNEGFFSFQNVAGPRTGSGWRRSGSRELPAYSWPGQSSTRRPDLSCFSDHFGLASFREVG